jgi:hypothetical protein
MKKKRHIIRNLFLLIIVVVGLGIGMLFIPRTVSVSYNEMDLQSYLDKGGIMLNDSSASIEQIFFGNYVAKGKRKVEGVITSAEATAILNEVANKNSILTKIRVKFVGENKYSASAQIGNDLSAVYNRFPVTKGYESLIDATVKGRSIYAEGSLVQSGSKSFEASFSTISFGYVPFPVNQANEYGTYLGSEMNRIFAVLPGFEMESFKIDQEGLHFKGTIPTEIQGT